MFINDPLVSGEQKWPSCLCEESVEAVPVLVSAEHDDRYIALQFESEFLCAQVCMPEKFRVWVESGTRYVSRL